MRNVRGARLPQLQLPDAFRLKAEATPLNRRARNDGPIREIAMERDVVCGMQVDPAKAAATSEYNGKTYYFCAKVCKTKFDANPSQYAKA